jgi:hypothetical protein
MTDNLEYWNRFADIDPSFTKAITGKSYKGTSPNPQYVIRCLTELFGPVGKGFGWEIKAEGFTPLGEEILHWCRIHFWHGDRSQWFESYGQTKALMKTKNGLMSDEDAPKKSLTDAIIKASSHIGIAANIFLGRWDDQKYVAQVDQEYREAEKPKAISAAENKRQLEQIDRELIDCRTPGDVVKLLNYWADEAQKSGWSKDYWDEARRRFSRRKKEIEDADQTVSEIQNTFGDSRVVNERITDKSGRELHNTEAA